MSKRSKQQTKTASHATDDHDQDVQVVTNADDLLTDDKFDIHVRLFRFIRHIGYSELAECVDTTGSYAIWLFILLSFIIIPYILIALILKLFLPIYLVYYRGFYCDVPLDKFLLFRFVFDTIWYILLLLPIESTFRHWRLLFLIDSSLLLLSAPLILSQVTQHSLCPTPILTFSTIIILVHISFYLLMFAGIFHRVLFVTKDPYHPAFFPTKDANGEFFTSKDDDDDQGRRFVKKAMDVLKGNIKIQNHKEYGRIDKRGNGGQIDTLDGDDSDLEYGLPTPDTFNSNDDELSDLDSNVELEFDE